MFQLEFVVLRRTVEIMSNVVNPRSTSSRYGIAATLVTALVTWAPAGAIRVNWTAEETHCAQMVGVDLLGDPEPGSRDYIKRLAWLADLVVYGTVGRIRQDPTGASHTQVRINVMSVRKGQLPKRAVTIALPSGSVHSERLEGMLDERPVDEPSFVRGETVLLFLTEGTPSSDPGQPYGLPELSYGLVNDAEFHIDGVTATLHGWGRGEYNIVRADYEIRQVVAAQATNCE